MTEAVKNKEEISKELINKFEEELLKHPQLTINPNHFFIDGVYAREIFIPAGTIVVGKLHKTDHLNIISKGTIIVLTEEGMKEVSAPCTLVSSSGIKRVGLAVTDTVWTTIHSNPENITDLQEIEDVLIEPKSIKEIEMEMKKCLG